MTGRAHGHRWMRFDDPIFRARHYVFYGPHRTLKTALKSVLRRDEYALLDEAELTAPCYGRTIGRAPDDDELDPYVTVIYVAPHQTALGACATLVHEIGHAVDFVLTARGVRHHPCHSEPRRYYEEALYARARVGLRL